jgi:hypothetical protein
MNKITINWSVQAPLSSWTGYQISFFYLSSPSKPLSVMKNCRHSCAYSAWRLIMCGIASKIQYRLLLLKEGWYYHSLRCYCYWQSRGGTIITTTTASGMALFCSLDTSHIVSFFLLCLLQCPIPITAFSF